MKSLIERANEVYDVWEAGKLLTEDALQSLDAVIAEARVLNLPDALLAGLNNKVILLRDSGALELALKTNQQVYEVAQEHGNNRYLSYAALFQGDLFRVQGKYEAARQAFREAYKFGDASQDYLASAYALQGEGKIVMMLRQADQVLMLGEKGLACINQYLESTAYPDPIHSSLQSAFNQLMARAALILGDIAAAWERAQQAMSYAQIRNSSLEIGNTYCIFAELAAHSEVVPEGFSADFSSYYETALKYYQKAQADSEMAFAHLMYAQQLHESGRTQEAVPSAQEACRLYKKLQNGAEFLKANKMLMIYRKAL